MIIPAVSVIIPCFNDGQFLPEAIQSVQGDAHSRDWEIIVVNDGSTDPHTKQVLAQLDTQRIKLVNHPVNLGLAAARNTGLQHARAPFVLPLDADNKIVSAVFADALAYLRENGQYAMVYTDHTKFGSDSFTTKIGTPSLATLFMKNNIDACCLLRREVLLQIGGYDANMPVMGNEDWELVIRLITAGYKLHYIAKSGFFYRVHSGSMYQSYTKQNEHLNRNYILTKYADQIPDAYWELFLDYQQRGEENAFLQHRLVSFRKHLSKNRVKAAIKILLGRSFGY